MFGLSYLTSRIASDPYYIRTAITNEELPDTHAPWESTVNTRRRLLIDTGIALGLTVIGLAVHITGMNIG